jgi:DNA primase
LAESQVKLLGRFTRRAVVNYDPDAAGQAATERSIALLLEQNFDVRVLALPGKADPDKFIREQGAEAYQKLLKESPEYVAYLIGRARQMDLSSAEGKLRAVNFLMPHVQRIPNRILRSEWATRIAQQLRVDEPVLRAALSKAAAERRSEVKTKPELTARPGRPAERRLIKMLAEAEGFREQLAREIREGNLHQGLETERIFTALVEACLSGEPLSLTAVTPTLEERDRRLVFEIVFEEGGEATWEEAESCLAVLRRRQATVELDAVQREFEAKTAAAGAAAGGQLRSLLERKQELRRRIEDMEG